MSTHPSIKRPIAITGASGLIGRRLVPLLVSAGHPIRVLSRTAEGQQQGIDSIFGDLRSRDTFDRLLDGVGAVIHLAGIAHTTLDTEKAFLDAYAINVEGTRSLARAAADAKIPRFIFMSSAHVYQGQRGLSLAESSPTTRDASYAGMKLEAENAVQELYAVTPGTAVILRPCLVYGPGVRFNLEALMGAVKRRLYVNPSGHRVMRSLVSVDTLASATLHALENESMSGVYNVADHEPVELSAWVRDLAALMHAPPPLSIPLWTLHTMATIGSGARALGLPSPLTRSTIPKLTESLTLDTRKLEATGFKWPKSNGPVLQEMVDAFLARCCQLALDRRASL